MSAGDGDDNSLSIHTGLLAGELLHTSREKSESVTMIQLADALKQCTFVI